MYLTVDVFQGRPLRYQFPESNRPYRVQYEIYYAKHEFFDTLEELQSVGAIDRTRYSRALTTKLLGCIKVHLVMLDPEKHELGTIIIKVHDEYAGWTQIAVDQSNRLDQKNYDCWWYIVDVAEDFVKRLNHVVASEAAKSGQHMSPSSSTHETPQGTTQATSLTVRQSNPSTSVTDQTQSSTKQKQRIAQMSTQDKLDRLKALRQANIKGNRVSISFTAACQRVPITPKTVITHAPELRRRWEDPSYQG